MTNEFFQDSKSFELSQQDLQVLLLALQEIAVDQGVSRELTGLQHEGGIPLEYAVVIDPGVIQELFHSHDSSLRVISARLLYQTPSPYEPGADERIMEYAGLTIEAELLASMGVSMEESLAITNLDGVSQASIDVIYYDNEGRVIDVAGKPDETLALVISDTQYASLINAITHTRPFMLDDLEAMHLLIDTLRA